MAVEIPTYKILKKEKEFELRKYNGYIIAKVKIKAKKYNEANVMGFRLLADFIFGNNTNKAKISMTSTVIQEEDSSEKIAMTAPVTVESLNNHIYTISFIMPKKYTLEDLPKPNNKEVSFEEIHSYEAAVIRFAGFVNEKTILEKTDELKNWLKKQKIKPLGNFKTARYDPPWTPWFIRRNEIIVPVE
jgi:hypothetical protein